MVKEIPLTQGKVALVDDEDYEWLNQYNWQASNEKGRFYVKKGNYLGVINGKQRSTSVRMHRLIMNAPENMVVDHINGNGLDNRKENLRIVSNRQNLQNLHIKKTSKYPGVSWQKTRNKWISLIRVNGKQK